MPGETAAARSPLLRNRKAATSHYQKGTVPFSLRENRDSPQVIVLRVLSIGRRPFPGEKENVS